MVESFRLTSHFRFRLRRRKNRYEPPLVVPEDGELSPNVLYERDSSYNAPSSSYNAPSSSYETPGYSNSYEENKMIFILLNHRSHIYWSG